MKKNLIIILGLVNITLVVLGYLDTTERLDNIEYNYIDKNDSIVRSVEEREERIENWYRNNDKIEIDELYWKKK